MKTVCGNNQCVGCMACMDICPKKAVAICDSLTSYNAEIDEKLCINCGACYKVCQVNDPMETRKPIEWFQGWAKEASIRQHSSSGGAAIELGRTFAKSGGIVCSCVFHEGEFKFRFVDSIDELSVFAGSKYVKSNPLNVYKQTVKLIRSGRKVLFIGLPCQCAALKKYVGKDSGGVLYTVDLICHGTPSPKLLESFLSQYGLSLNELENINFRKKDNFSVAHSGRYIVTKGVVDCYSIAFLCSLIYTENCYACKYAKKERLTDLTIGDSWGSELSEEEQSKGVSLILCNSEKGRQLLKESDLYLTKVDIEKAVRHNSQLNHPAIRHKNREKFFRGFAEKKRFNTLVTQCCFNVCFRQFIKMILIKIHLWPGGGKSSPYGLSVEMRKDEPVSFKKSQALF